MGTTRLAVSAAWDVVARIWWVLATWLALRGPRHAVRLAKIRRPMRFVRAALIGASGPRRPLALAIAMLPRRRRAEASIAFVACRTLAAIDTLSDAPDARRRISAAVAYLVGEASGPTQLETRGPRTFDSVLAARLALVRAALDGLPGEAARRCCDIIERVGDGLIRAREDQRRHADRAFGEAMIYAIRLAAPIVRPPFAACRAAGRALPLACTLDAAPTAHAGDVVLDRALPALAFVPRLLRWLPAATDPGTRAAAIVLATTMFPFAHPALGAPRKLRHPLRAALAAAGSRAAYLTTVTAMEDALDATRAGLLTRLEIPMLASQLGARRSDATLIALALELVQAAPELPVPPRSVGAVPRVSSQALTRSRV